MKIGKVINYNIKIEPSANFGFVVNVGCGLFVFADTDSLENGLRDYLHDPEKYEIEYNAIGSTIEAAPDTEQAPTLERR